jgi:hypothetical protein
MIRVATKIARQANSSAELNDTASKLGQILFLSISMKPLSDLESAPLVMNGILTLIINNSHTRD